MGGMLAGAWPVCCGSPSRTYLRNYVATSNPDIQATDSWIGHPQVPLATSNHDIHPTGSWSGYP